MATQRGDSVGLTPLSRTLAVDILVHGPQSRASLADRLGISAATVTRLIQPLLARQVLVEAEVLRTPGRGRWASALDVVPGRYRFIGIKLTADAMYAVTTDLRAQIVDHETVALPSLEVSDVVWTVCGAVDRLRARSDVPVDAVGVTVGGRVVDGELVADSPFLHWHDVPLRSLLSAEVGLPVHLGNDVVGLTKAQHWFGHGKGYASFALLTVGAGVGYGLVVNHDMVPTSMRPMSHYAVDPAGPLCPVGHRGCMTAYVTSDAIAAAVSERHGGTVGFAEALAMADGGDPDATEVVEQAAYALGRVACAVGAATGVDRIILSGEGVHLVEIAAQALHAGFTQYDAGADATKLVVRPMDFLEWARGAAALAIQAEFPRAR